MDDCFSRYGRRSRVDVTSGILIAAIMFFLIPISLLINATMLGGMVKTRQYATATGRFFCCLCVSDIGMAVFAQPCIGLLLTKYLMGEHCSFALTAQFLMVTFCHLSAFFVVLIAIDRFIHMTLLLRYKRVMTRRRSLVMILLSVLLAFLLGITYTLSSMHGFFIKAHVLVLALDAILLSTALIMYGGAFARVRFHVMRTKSLQDTKTSLRNPRRNGPMYAVVMARAVLLIVAMVFLCYAPYITSSFVWCAEMIMGFEPSTVLETALYGTYILVYLSTIVNSCIFISTNKKLRTFYRDLLFTCLRRKKVEIQERSWGERTQDTHL